MTVTTDDDRDFLAAAFSGHRFCQSPIEQILGGAIEGVLSFIEPAAKFVVLAQHKIGRFTADLAVFQVHGESSLSGNLIAIVECDGHEFHDRTKEQAKRDRVRDRWFLGQGIACMRFTGSEIHSDPYKCAAEVCRFASKQLSRVA